MVQKVQYKLYYFDVRGGGEAIRMLLKYAKKPFEDVRVSMEHLANNEIKSFNFPYGKLPVLEVDGKKQLAQSCAILRYMGEKFGLLGADEWERAKVNELIDFQKDMNSTLSPYFYTKAGFKQGDVAQLRKDVFLPNAEILFPQLVKVLKRSNSGFCMPSGLTIVDFLLANYLYTLMKLETEEMEKYPELGKLVRNVHSLPQLKDYIATRNDTVA